MMNVIKQVIVFEGTRWSVACCVSPRREIKMRVQTLAGIVPVIGD
jgi:hypothetical protein